VSQGIFSCKIWNKGDKLCGIVGFNWKDKNLLLRLSELLRHRGPDQSGFFCNFGVSIAHRRLSILDLSSKGRQPMANEDDTVFIVFNGEIFNYKELKKELIKKGHRFSSNTDTEVIVHLYEDWGEELVTMLNGQFSFAIYDRKKHTFFLARDRVGILPLFYYYKEGRFIFSSELKVILGCGVKKEIDEDALVRYLRFGYIPAPYCILKDTFKLKPGHYLVFDLGKREIIKYEKYWDIRFTEELMDVKMASQYLYSLLQDAVRARLIADVPVGAFLSGGIDSSAIVSIIKKYKKHLKTFSIKFDYPKFDESIYARKVANFFNTQHYEIAFSSKDVREIISKLVFHFDEPFGDPSAVPTYLISKIARKWVTVCLSGDGGDELLGGYNRYRYFFILRILNSLPRFVKLIFRLFLSFIIRLYPKFEIERLRELLRFGRLGDIELFEKLCEKIDRKDLERLLRRKVDFGDTTAGIKTRKGLSSLQHYDVVNYLEGDILTKVDRAAMSVSLETRPPFLDHKVMEFCFQLNNCLKIKGGKGKWILKRALKGILPEETIRRKKKGFGVPIRHYLKNELRDLVEKYVFNYDGHNLFDREFIKSMERKGKLRDTTRLYWNIMMFNMWYERWIKGNIE